MQALTKYPSGGGDVLMGSVTTRDEALHLRLKVAHMRLGLGVGGNDVELVLRSLPSLPLRYAAQDARRRDARRMVADAARGRARAASGAARVARPRALGAAVQRGRRAVLDRLRPALRQPRRSTPSSTRCAVSDRLFVGRAGQPGRAVRPRRRCAARSALRRGTLVRFSIGLEAVEDLIADCGRRLPALAAALRRVSRERAAASSAATAPS